MTVDRRRFLAAGAALAVAGCSGSSDRSDRRSSTTDRAGAGGIDAPSRDRVVVVGAGLAGLTAAITLRGAGWDVVVVEARDRVGGRVRTLGRAGDETDGVFGADADGRSLLAEGGGESIDDGHDRILAWIDELGLSTQRRIVDRESNALVLAGGSRRTGAMALSEAGGLVGVDYGRAYDAISALVGDADPSDVAGWRGAEELDGRDAGSFIASLDLHPLARFVVESDLRSSYNCDLSELSLLFLAQQESVGPDGDEETMRVAGGNSALVDAMVDRLVADGGEVRTSSPVVAIGRSAGEVSVEVAGGDVLVCRNVVLAVPPPPLRAVRFEPALPSGLAAAITGVDLGSTVKVSSRYDRRPWTAAGYSGLTVTDLDYHVAWEATDGAADGGVPPQESPAVLTTFTSGAAGAMLTGLGAVERIATVGAQLDATYSASVASGGTGRTDRAATVAWAAEEFTGGGYAFWRPGQVLPMSGVWRESTGPIWFAGEHTEVLAGYMESAVRSGERVAAAIGAPA